MLAMDFDYLDRRSADIQAEKKGLIYKDAATQGYTLSIRYINNRLYMV